MDDPIEGAVNHAQGHTQIPPGARLMIMQTPQGTNVQWTCDDVTALQMLGQAVTAVAQKIAQAQPAQPARIQIPRNGDLRRFG